MIPAPFQLCADLTLIAAMGVGAAFGLGLVALGVRCLLDGALGRTGRNSAANRLERNCAHPRHPRP